MLQRFGSNLPNRSLQERFTGHRPAAKQDKLASGKETNCRPYVSGATTTYKPTGLLQKYAEGDGVKVARGRIQNLYDRRQLHDTPASGPTRRYLKDSA